MATSTQTPQQFLAPPGRLASIANYLAGNTNSTRRRQSRVAVTVSFWAIANAVHAMDSALMFECNERAKVAAVSLTESTFPVSSVSWQASSTDQSFKIEVVPRRGDSEALNQYRWTCKLGSGEALFEVWEEAPNHGKPGPGSATVITKLTLKYASRMIVDSSILSDSSGEYGITKRQFRLSGPEIYEKYPSPQLRLEIQGIDYAGRIPTYANPNIRLSVDDGNYAINRRTTASLPLTDRSIDPMLTWK